jgi:hypothetical protein
VLTLTVTTSPRSAPSKVDSFFRWWKGEFTPAEASLAQTYEGSGLVALIPTKALGSGALYQATLTFPQVAPVLAGHPYRWEFKVGR